MSVYNRVLRGHGVSASIDVHHKLKMTINNNFGVNFVLPSQGIGLTYLEAKKMYPELSFNELKSRGDLSFRYSDFPIDFPTDHSAYGDEVNLVWLRTKIIDVTVLYSRGMFLIFKPSQTILVSECAVCSPPPGLFSLLPNEIILNIISLAMSDTCCILSELPLYNSICKGLNGWFPRMYRRINFNDSLFRISLPTLSKSIRYRRVVDDPMTINTFRNTIIDCLKVGGLRVSYDVESTCYVSKFEGHQAVDMLVSVCDGYIVTSTDRNLYWVLTNDLRYLDRSILSVARHVQSGLWLSCNHSMVRILSGGFYSMTSYERVKIPRSRYSSADAEPLDYVPHLTMLNSIFYCREREDSTLFVRGKRWTRPLMQIALSVAKKQADKCIFVNSKFPLHYMVDANFVKYCQVLNNFDEFDEQVVDKCYNATPTTNIYDVTYEYGASNCDATVGTLIQHTVSYPVRRPVYDSSHAIMGLFDNDKAGRVVQVTCDRYNAVDEYSIPDCETDDEEDDLETFADEVAADDSLTRTAVLERFMRSSGFIRRRKLNSRTRRISFYNVNPDLRVLHKKGHADINYYDNYSDSD